MICARRNLPVSTRCSRSRTSSGLTCCRSVTQSSPEDVEETQLTICVADSFRATAAKEPLICRVLLDVGRLALFLGVVMMVVLHRHVVSLAFGIAARTFGTSISRRDGRHAGHVSAPAGMRYVASNYRARCDNRRLNFRSAPPASQPPPSTTEERPCDLRFKPEIRDNKKRGGLAPFNRHKSVKRAIFCSLQCS